MAPLKENFPKCSMVRIHQESLNAPFLHHAKNGGRIFSRKYFGRGGKTKAMFGEKSINSWAGASLQRENDCE